jgi:predicted AlkP superfamily phosphohydrolase/phosphomutase
VSSEVRVLQIQLDAADAAVLLDGIDQGWLPTLARLRDAGAWGVFDAPPGFGSGAAWACHATGVSPATHGRYFYRQVHAGSYEARAFAGGDFLCPAVWNTLSDAGRRVAVIDAPGMPVCDGINGISIADWLTHDLVYQELRTFPAELADDLTGRFGANPLMKCDQPGGRDAAGHRLLTSQLVERVEQKRRAVCHYLEQGPWDFFSVAFADPHCVGHQSWHLHDPRHPLHPLDESGVRLDPVRRVYRAIDDAIGAILEQVGPETTVLVVSLTGMAPNFTGNMILDDVLRRIDGVDATTRVALTTRLKRALKRVLPLDVRRRYRPLKRRVEESLQTSDRARRPSFMVPHNDITGAIRLNIAGREADGVLRPGPEVDDYVEMLTRELLALRNAETGDRVVERVTRVADHCKGPALDQLPDLFAHWARESFPDRVRSDRIGTVELRHRGNRTGDHLARSIYLANGPGVSPGRYDDVTTYDFAPTIASLLDVEPAASDGRVVPELAGRLGATWASPERDRIQA